MGNVQKALVHLYQVVLAFGQGQQVHVCVVLRLPAVDGCVQRRQQAGRQLAVDLLVSGVLLRCATSHQYLILGMPNRDAMAKSASALAHDESEGRPSVEAVPDELRAQVAAGQCVAIRGERGYTRGEERKLQSGT